MLVLIRAWSWWLPGEYPCQSCYLSQSVRPGSHTLPHSKYSTVLLKYVVSSDQTNPLGGNGNDDDDDDVADVTNDGPSRTTASTPQQKRETETGQSSQLSM